MPEAEPATAPAPPAQAGAESSSAQPEAVELAASEKKEAPSGAKTEGPKAGEKPEGKSAAAEGKAEGKEAPAAPGGGKRPSAGGGPVRLRMPEPPSAPSAATMGRIRKVKARAGAAAGAQAELPAGAEQVGEARQAVTEPDAEATAKAQADLITALGEQPKPSPEIEKLCERIKQVIRDKRPPDQDALEEADPEAAASDAGNQLNSSVQGDTQRVQGSYDSIQGSPTGAAPAKGEELPGQPPAAGTAPVNAQAATPDAIPDKNLSLDADAADSKQKMQDAGMDSESAKLVQSGPVAEARDAQGELEKTAKEDPAKVLAGQQQALGKAEANMAELQQQALASLTASRAGAVKSTTQRQHGMVGSEESTRTRASEEAKQIFTQTQSQVTSLLQPLAQNAMQEWDAAKDVLVSKFKADLADVKRRVDERHSGVTGWAVGVWDAVTGLPSWAERDYSRAERNFGDGVCDRMKQISVKVNTVIATCDALIKSARERIAKIFADLPAGLREWAAGEQAKFDGQLNKLHDQAMAARDGFNKDLVKNASQAVQEVREEVAELRKKAGGLLGRIADAVNRFLEDPAKFIIEGLLELVGIPPASFWALIAKIKKVIKDIADDPLKFANNLMAGLGKGFGQFFDNIGTHLLKGFLNWLLGGLGDAGVQIPKDLSLKSIITFLLQLMGITWPRIRKILAKHLGEKNVALAEKVYSLVSLLIEKGPEGIYEMIKEKLDPQSLVDQVVQMAVDYMITAIMKAAAVRIALLFNPAGAIFQALEAIYRVLKWIFENAARIFTLVETVVNGIADIIAGNLGGFANAIEKGLGMLIAPVIGFIADYLGFGDLPGTIASKVKSFQQWILGLIEQALVWLIAKGKALLAAVGIGKKEKKEEKKGGTPHEQAVHEVVSALATPPEDESAGYKEIRAVKEKEAGGLVAMHNESLAAEHVKMSVTFGEPSADEQDHDLDFEVAIAPNTTKGKGATKIPVPEPIAGEHQVKRDTPPPAAEPEQSHHVPAKALAKGIARFLSQAAEKLGGKDWKGVAEAAVVAKAFRTRAVDSEGRADPGDGLSAILLSEKAHKGDSGAHSKLNAGRVLDDIGSNPAMEKIAVVKRKTATKIGTVTSYIAVNPQTPSWRVFLDDVWDSINNPSFKARPNQPASAKSAVELILTAAREEFEEAEAASEDFLQVHVVDATNKVIDAGVSQAYTRAKVPVASGMESAKYGTAQGRKKALAQLDSTFNSSWQPLREEIIV